MRAHVADGADAPVGPAAPVERMVDRVVVDLARGPEEQVPGELVGRRDSVPKEPAARVITPFMFQGRSFAFGGSGAGRGMPCGQYASGRLVHTCTSVTVPMAPDWMYSFTRRASSDECPWLPIWVCSLRFGGAPRETPAFLHRPGQRLLHVHVFAEIHRRERDVRVRVIRRRDHHRVDVLLLLEHLAVVVVTLRLRKLRLQLQPAVDLRLRALALHVVGGLREPLLRLLELLAGCRRNAYVDVAPVDVAQRDDVLARQRLQVGAAHAADAHGRDVDAVIGGNAALLAVAPPGRMVNAAVAAAPVAQEITARQGSRPWGTSFPFIV